MAHTTFDPERLTPTFGILGVIALAIVFHTYLALPFVVIFFTLACLSDRRTLYLFGPFLHHELRGMTRKYRNHLWRPLIAILAAAPVLALHFSITQLPPEDAPPESAIPMIAIGGFLFVFWILFILTMSLASTFLSYGIAEDRESKRLDFQLVTDLRGRELVIGKMLSRIFAVLMYPAAAVPIILVMPLLFRMDPWIILYAFAYGGVMLVSISGLSALGSVIASSKKASGNLMALFVMPYLFLIFMLSMLRFWPEIWLFPGTPAQPTRYCLGDVIEWLAVGNPLTLLINWATVGLGAGNLNRIAADFPNFASFHLLVGGLAFLYAARKIRYASANSGEVTNPKPDERPAKPRPPVSDEPIKWKEVFCNPLIVAAQKNRKTNFVASAVLVFIPALALTAAALFPLGIYGEVLRKEIAPYAPIIITIIGIFSAQNLALQSIARERERGTMLNLLLTDLSPHEILAQKFAGVIRIGRGVLFWLLIVGIPTIFCGAYPWWAFLGLILAGQVFTRVMACAGFCFSATAPTIQKATQRFGWAFMIVVFVFVILAIVFSFLGRVTQSFVFLKYFAVALLPPFSVIGPAFVNKAPIVEWPYWIAGFLSGLLIYSFVGWFLWKLAVRRFTKACDGSHPNGPLLDNRDP